MEGAGFEPAKAEPADLQSAPVDRLGTPPEIDEWCRLPESNWRPTDYKSVALPTELSRHYIKWVRILEYCLTLCKCLFENFSIFFFDQFFN